MSGIAANWWAGYKAWVQFSAWLWRFRFWAIIASWGWLIAILELK